MKYIREFIKKLPEEEFQKFTLSQFTKTELALVNYYKNDEKELKDKEISEVISIKSSTLKKLQSSLLIKTIQILSSEDVFDQFSLLSNINCHKIILHIGKRKIKELKKGDKKDALKKLILSIPYNLLSAIVTDYSVTDLKLLKIEFLKIEDKKTTDFLKLQVLLLILEIYQYDKWSKAKMVKFKNEIDKIKLDKQDLELNFWKNKLLGDYYHKVDEAKYMAMVKANYDLLANNKIKLPLKLEINTNLPYCFYLIYKNKFEETYTHYFKMKKKYPKEIDGRNGLRYVDLVSQVCIVLGNYNEAKNLIFEGYPIEKEKPGKFSEMYFGNSTILAMIDILENNLDLAFDRIQAAKIGLKKQYFLLLDSLLRLTEQAYYFKIGDYDFADTLNQKNIKFYQYHNDMGLDILENGHKLINAYSKQVFDKKPLSPKVLSYLESLKEKEFAFIGHFLENIAPSLKK